MKSISPDFPLASRLRRLAIVAGVLAAIGVITTAASVSAATPVATAMTQAQLKVLATSVHHPVYWVGPRVGYTYEVTRLKDGRIYIRYLPSGVKVGDPRPSFLVVGTYPMKNALAATQAAAKRVGSDTETLAANGVGFAAKPPTSFYLAYPQSNFQVEIYSASPGRAQQLAVSGKVAPIA